MKEPRNKVLMHPDLEIEVIRGPKGEVVYIGRSRKYEPYEASAETAIDCFFQFNIQLSEQKAIIALMKAIND